MFIQLFFTFLNYFIPGYIILQFITKKKKCKINLIESIVFSFSISLLVNYCISMILIVCHIYNRNSVVAIMIVEYMLLTFLLIKKQESLNNWKCLIKSAVEKEESEVWYNYCYVLTFFSMVWVIHKIINNFHTIFFDNDAIAAYNQWAMSLANGNIPKTAYYPIMIVSNWSWGYVFTGTKLQFVNKGIMSFFFFFILLLVIELFVMEKKQRVLLVIPCICIVVHRMSDSYICEGSMDYAVSFFTILGIYSLINAKRYFKAQDNTKASFYVLMIMLSIIELGVTKQAGVLLGGLIIIASLYSKVLKKQDKKLLIYSMLLYLILVVGFYLWTFIGVKTGNNSSYVSWLIGGIHAGRNVFQRIIYSLKLLYWCWFYMLIPMIIISFLGENDELKRIITIIFIPYTIVWMLGFSYDLRNWTVGSILWAIYLAYGIDYIVSTLYKKVNKKIINKFLIVGTIVAALIIMQLENPADKLIEMQNSQIKDIGDPELNRAMYAFFDNKEIDGVILSYKNHVGLLPELGEHFKSASLNYNSDEEFELYYSYLQDETISYLVFPDVNGYELCPRIKKDFMNRIESGEINVIWSDGIKMFACIEHK